MNIKKLAQMARDENPNRFLAELSIHWSEQSKKGNPVNAALHLVGHRRFRVVMFVVIITYAVFSFIWRQHMTNGNSMSIWMIIGIAIVVLSLAEMVIFRYIFIFDYNEIYYDTKSFAAAVSELECVIGKPIEQWYDEDDIQGQASVHLKNKAKAVKTAEEIEKAEVQHKPWGGIAFEKTASPKRYAFEKSFELLTTLLPLSKDKKIYYGDKSMEASTES